MSTPKAEPDPCAHRSGPGDGNRDCTEPRRAEWATYCQRHEDEYREFKARWKEAEEALARGR